MAPTPKQIAAYQKSYRQDNLERLTKYDRERKQAKRAWLNDYKMSRGCQDCGYAGHPAVLEFDHVRGVKSFTIGHKAHYSLDRLKAEVAKCDVVCANCHRLRHHRGDTDA